MRLINPEMRDAREKLTKLKQSGEQRLALIETEKLKKMQRDYGIVSSFSQVFLNITQGFTVLVWAGLVQRFSFKVEDYPEMMTGGFLWFKDLSMTDPYFILPLLNSITIFLNTYVDFNNVRTQILPIPVQCF